MIGERTYKQICQDYAATLQNDADRAFVVTLGELLDQKAADIEVLRARIRRIQTPSMIGVIHQNERHAS